MGMCKRINEFGQQITGKPCGTFGFMEMLEGTYDFRVDWYCLGILIFEMATVNWNRNIEFNAFILRLEKKAVEFNQENMAMMEIVLKFTCKNPNERISSLQELKRMKFFEGIDWERLENRIGNPPHIPVQQSRLLSSDYSRAQKFLSSLF